MPKFLRVTAAIIMAQQKILITQRHLHDRMGGKWEFPGGKIEPGESPEACLRRELFEELGVQAEIHDLFGVANHAYPDFQVELLFYRATILSGEIMLHAHHDSRWVTVDELDQFDFCEADRPILAKLRSCDLLDITGRSANFSLPEPARKAN